MTSPKDVTVLLRGVSGGEAEAREALYEAVYTELKRLAHHHLRGERKEHTLQTTALVNEAYLKMVDPADVAWNDRKHFFATASQAIRRILVDHARARRREKRGGGEPPLSLDEAPTVANPSSSPDLLELDQALTRLAETHPDHVRVVELRFFAGFTAREVAEALGVTERTVERYWKLAKERLRDALTRE